MTAKYINETLFNVSMVGKGNPKQLYDILIIGTGVTGWGAAMYAGRMQLKTLIVGDTPGGTIMLTDDVENYPGFIKLTGSELAEKIQKHAESYELVTLREEKAENLIIRISVSGKA